MEETDVNTLLNELLDKLADWLQALVTMLPNLAVAIVVVVLAWVLGAVIARFVGRQLERLSTQKQVRNLIVKVVHTALVAGGIVLALGILNLHRTVASLLAGVGVLGLALGFAFQDIAANFMAGILLTVRHPFGIGDVVETGDFFGRIEEINLRATIGRTPQGQRVVIPNRQVFGNPIINYSVTGERRIDLDCGVAYGDDLERAEEIAVKAVQSLEGINREKPVELFYQEFGDSSINFTLRFWIEADQKTYHRTRSQAIKALKRAFDDHGITIPFPIRTLDFGVVGGEPLAAHLRGLVPRAEKDPEAGA